MISAEELEKEIEALVTEHCRALERYLRCAKVRLPEYYVGEVINDALLVIADKRRRGHVIGNPGAYLFRVARNAAVDRLKTRYAAEILGPEAAAECLSGHDMVADTETSHDLRSAIRQLSRRQQQVIELRYLRDFTVEETAEILGIAKGTVGPTTTAALRRLREIMTERGEPGEEQTR